MSVESPAQPLPRAGLLAGLRLLGLTVLALVLLTETVPFVLEVHAAAPATTPGLVMVVASQVLCLPFFWLPRARIAAAWSVLALLLGGLFLVELGGIPDALVPWMIPGYWFLVALVLGLLDLHRRRYVALAVTGTVLLVAQNCWVALRHGWQWTSVADLVWLVQPVASMLLFGDALVVAARQRDRALAEQDRAQREQLSTDALAASRREAARMLHDHVLHALHALSRTEQGHSAEMARQECQAAHEALAQQPAGSERIRLEELLSADPTLARAGARLEGSGPALPSSVAHSIAAAAHEALSNVASHAHARSARVVVEVLDIGVQVVVADDGRGFDPSTVPADRLGVQGSIGRRMADAGGAAVTHTSPGQGTRVVLTWPRTEPDGARRAWTAVPDDLTRPLLVRTALPGLLAGLVMTLVMAPRSTQPLLAAGAGLAAVLLGLQGMRVLRRRAMDRSLFVALCVAAVLGWEVNLWLVPVAPTVDYVLWMAWVSSALVHLVVLSLSLRTGAMVASGWLLLQATLMLARYQDPALLWELSSLLTAGAGDIAITLLVLLSVRTVAQQATGALDRASQLRMATARARTDLDLRQFWSERVTEGALPLMQDVATGRSDPADPVVRETARLMESSLRDELLLGPAHVPLLRALGQVRQAGWTASSTVDREDSAERGQAAARLLGLLGAPARPGQRVTLSAPGGIVAAVVVAATPPQHDLWRSRLAAQGGGLDEDPDFARLWLPAPSGAVDGPGPVRSGAVAVHA